MNLEKPDASNVRSLGPQKSGPQWGKDLPWLLDPVRRPERIVGEFVAAVVPFERVVGVRCSFVRGVDPVPVVHCRPEFPSGAETPCLDSQVKSTGLAGP